MRYRRVVPLASVAAALTACDAPPSCVGRLADACRKAQDLAYLAGVQIADDAASGNAVLGEAGAIGSTGKAHISIRVNGARRDGPQLTNVTVRTDSTVAPSGFGSTRQLATSISIDAAVGGIHGVRVGSTEIGAIDILGSVTATPNTDRGSLHIGGSPIVLGLGVRLGILSETKTLPAVSFAASLRLPRRFTVTTAPLPTDSGESVQIEIQQGEVSTLGLRLASSKQLGHFGVTAGAGQDTHYAVVDYDVVGGSNLGTGYDDTSFNVSRSTLFAGASYTAGDVTFAAEFGRVFGGHVPPMMNAFGARSVTAARNYVTLGVRIPAGRTNNP